MKKNIQFVVIFLCTIFFNHIIADQPTQDDINQHHVICSYETQPTSQDTLDAWNEKAHTATYEIKQYFKNNHNATIDTNNLYPRHKDSVFFINFNYDHGSWTLYKPSCISHEDFIAQAKKIYERHNLDVVFAKESTIKILGTRTGFDGEYLTLHDFEKYRKQTDHELDNQIKNLQKKAVTENDFAAEIAQLKKIKNMNDFFFWHLQIPTTGLLSSKKYNSINDEYKPLAWNFLLWDVAPKKGRGAQVVIIDTGASAFNLKEQEFSDTYKKNVNIYASCDLQSYGYNLVSENGLDPIRQIAINFGHYCDHKKFDINELMQKLPNWIINYIKNGDKSQIEQYFTQHTKKTSLDASETKLNERGYRLLEDLLHGKYGIAPKDSKPFFTVINLEKPYSQNGLLETLSAPKIIGNKDTFAAGHGTFTQGIVHGQNYNNQGIIGLAPNAHVTMIKAFHDTGTTNKTTLNGALERAIALKSPIVSMSLKITDEIDEVQDATLKKLIDSIDYVVAASGNDGDDPKLYNKEAYPAKFDSVAFDVGAFQYDNGNYSICSFTQKETNVGPKFLAPGYDIFSSTLTPHQTADSMYAFMSGTSVAVPVVTGFLALALAEFQNDFSRQEILKVIYKFSIKLNSSWEKDTILGTIDMRSALLCLHALKSLKANLHKNPKLEYSFEKNFDNLVQAIYTINYYLPSCYQQKSDFSLTKDFAHYNKAIQFEPKKSDDTKINYFVPSKNKSAKSNLALAINFIVDTIISVIDTKKVIKAKRSNIDTNLQSSLQIILLTEPKKLFTDLSTDFQHRINVAIHKK